MKLISKRAGSYIYEIAGNQYEITRESPARDGGTGLWYVAFLDPNDGPCLDERVPEAQYRTLREAKHTLRAYLQHQRNVDPLDLLERRRRRRKVL